MNLSTEASTAMLGRVVLLVHDPEEALAFYRDALGAEPIFDRTAGGRRLLHVSLPGQPAGEGASAPVGLWLLEPCDADRDLVGRQAGGQPLLVLYTPDCRAAVERFAAAGGEVRRPPRTEDGATFAHVGDLYGNELLLVELGAG